MFVAISFLEYFNGISFKFHREVAKRPLPWLFVLSSWLETRRGNQDETETTKILNQPSIQQWVDILCKIKRKLYNIKNPRKAICTRCHSKYPYSSKLCWEDLLFLSLVVSSQWKYFLLLSKKKIGCVSRNAQNIEVNRIRIL